jgi:hypothetical protein
MFMSYPHQKLETDADWSRKTLPDSAGAQQPRFSLILGLVKVIVGLAPSVTAPVPVFRFVLPANAKLPFQFCVLLVESVTDEPLSIVPPAMVNRPEPIAVAVLRTSVPALSVVPPL